LGDSYTIGEGLVPAQRWPVQLAALLRQKGVATAEPQIIAPPPVGRVPDLAGAITDANPRGPFDLVTLPDRLSTTSIKARTRCATGPASPRC